MTPDQFITKWQGLTLTERASAQEHFLDLCRLLGEPNPTEVDPKEECYLFQKGARKAGGGDGWADVWRRGCFGWEYKGPGKDLAGAFRQLQLYTPALEYPPLLIVSDIQTIEIHTAFTGLVPVTHRLTVSCATSAPPSGPNRSSFPSAILSHFHAGADTCANIRPSATPFRAVWAPFWWGAIRSSPHPGSSSHRAV